MLFISGSVKNTIAGGGGWGGEEGVGEFGTVGDMTFRTGVLVTGVWR